jgi:hypothetical protein
MQRHKLFFVIAMVLIFSSSLVGVTSQPALAAHGCLTNEPDRDEDGVPDKDDPAPDDPTAGGLAEKYCGAEPLSMKMFFIPFSSDIRGPVTKDSIEGKKANAIWFCSKNQTGDSILAILEQAVKVRAEVMEAERQKMAPNHIRLKLVTMRSGTAENIYYADKNGVGTKNNVPFLLWPEQMSEIEGVIQKLTPKCGEATKTHCDLPESPQ